MKKILLYTIIIILVASFVGCRTVTTEVNNNRNAPKQEQVIPSKVKETVVRKGKDLKGIKLTAADEQGRTLTFQIREVELDPKDPEKETYLYTVFYLDTTDSRWKNLCQPDAQNVAKAISLSGSWDETGGHIESEKLVTFACTSGVLAKCLRFGYKPWKTIQGRSLREFHQACTRMLRADYCGNGKGHTREGTPVDVHDVLGIQKPTSDDGMVFEAAWRADGATCINHPRWYETLSEIRNECPEKLKGRTNEGGRCATTQQARQNWPDSLIFNDSLLRKP